MAHFNFVSGAKFLALIRTLNNKATKESTVETHSPSGNPKFPTSFKRFRFSGENTTYFDDTEGKLKSKNKNKRKVK